MQRYVHELNLVPLAKELLLMVHEEHEELAALLSLLEKLDLLIDDNNKYEVDSDEYYLDVLNCNDEVQDQLDEILESDPELPLDYLPLRERMSTALENKNVSCGDLQKLGVEYLTPLIKEVKEILHEGDEEPKRTLLDNLNIPIMSLVNNQAHPTRPGYIVYHFKFEEHAAYFEELLKEQDLFYERFDEVRDDEDVFWFGVRDQDHDAVEIINYTVKGKFRKPMIKDKGARYVIVAFGVIVVLIAIIGAIVSNS